MNRERAGTGEIRSAGVLAGGIIALLFGVVIPVARDHVINLYLYSAGSIIMFFGVAAPDMLRPLHSAWMKLGRLLGWINTRFILGLFFWVILFPAGIIMKVMGKDPLKRKFDTGAPTYREPSRRPESVHFERPF